jgi:hypothetical protein
MNDYAHGALEALAWTLNLSEETEDRVHKTTARGSKGRTAGRRHGELAATPHDA